MAVNIPVGIASNKLGRVFPDKRTPLGRLELHAGVADAEFPWLHFDLGAGRGAETAEAGGPGIEGGLVLLAVLRQVGAFQEAGVLLVMLVWRRLVGRVDA